MGILNQFFWSVQQGLVFFQWVEKVEKGLEE